MRLAGRLKLFVVTLIFVTFAIGIWGCAKRVEDSPKGKVRVMTTLFTIFDFARNVGGDAVEVSLLVPPGVEVHTFEPKPQDIIKTKDTDLFIYTGDAMEPWVRTFLKSVDSSLLVVVDASHGIVLSKVKHGHDHGDKDSHHDDHHHGEEAAHHHHGNLDPHIWLDFANAQKMVDTIAEALAAKDPGHKETYLKNASNYKAKLDALDRAYRQTLATCQKKVIIHGGHFAFNYLAKRYGLDYESAYPGSFDAEPTPRRLIELRKQLKEHGLDTVFYEELIDPRTAEIIAKDTGSSVRKLHGAHNVSKEEMDRGVTFLQLMEGNLEGLRAGLKCKEK
ncbi:metal ABC transporter solute-binding protein, Zn/Mn family [Syntrophorhabdus aromaticivorans]|uniref:metal ABC transporter solute-binding protein, Zn/Mn family n=1 Tax=Syntrophorhabdus aromaticivorans TaxID=328301 RepID=UPI00041EA91E|nr:zinc ABC transporter substrate-binding protein [Syntrophorhabdus aromaticivorans]